MTENELSYKIIGVALELHKSIGPGLLESVYENALSYDLKEAGLKVNCQVPMPFVYKEVKMDVGYRIDLIVNDKVLIEIKSIESFSTRSFCTNSNLFKIIRSKIRIAYKF